MLLKLQSILQEMKLADFSKNPINPVILITNEKKRRMRLLKIRAIAESIEIFKVVIKGLARLQLTPPLPSPPPRGGKVESFSWCLGGCLGGSVWRVCLGGSVLVLDFWLSFDFGVFVWRKEG